MYAYWLLVRDGYSRINSLPTAPPSAIPTLVPTRVLPLHSYRTDKKLVNGAVFVLLCFQSKAPTQVPTPVPSTIAPTVTNSPTQFTTNGTLPHTHTYIHTYNQLQSPFSYTYIFVAPTQDAMCCANTVYSADEWPNCQNRLGLNIKKHLILSKTY